MNYTAVTVARRPYGRSVADRWNPWRALRSRPHITFARAVLPVEAGGAVCARWPDGAAVIVVDPSLSRRERSAALAHELVHDERGPTRYENAPDSWAAVVAREEATVNAIVARRLVPLDELEDFVRRRVASELTTTPVDVAEEWDTTEELAELAMLLLDPGRP